MGETDYEKYIRTSELLSLQKAPAELACHDELQFQVVHQVAELWMKLIDFELHRCVALLDEDQLVVSLGSFARVDRLQRLLLQQMDLLDTMPPPEYMTIRAALGRGSGQESPGFRTLLRLPGEIVWPAFERVLARRCLTLPEIYKEHRTHVEVFRVAEALLDYDQLLQSWRQRHLLMVYRVIGTGTPSLKGKPSELLAHGMKQRFFPALWDVRDELFAAWSAGVAAEGGDSGYHG